MIYAVFGFFIGTTFGFFLAALMNIVAEDDYREDRESSEIIDDRQDPRK